MRERFLAVVAASQRTKASILHEALDARLPGLEERYAPQLSSRKRKTSATRN